MPVSSIQYAQFPWHYADGLNISNNATTPNTKLNVAKGNALDGSGTYQMVLDDAIVIDATTNGYNGLDTGSLAASSVYAVYLIGDPVNANPTGAILSLGYASTLPLLPTGYSIYTLIGFCTTDSSSHILKGYWVGLGDSERMFLYDVPQATAVTAGNATSYTAIDLSAFIPSFINNNIFGVTPFGQPVIINSTFTPGAAGRVLNMKTYVGTGDMIAITGQVTSVPVTTQSLVLATNNSNVSSISYKVSNSGDAAAINVAGYHFFV